jgi:hypothetical protein
MHPRFSARFKVKCADEASARRFLVPLLFEELERFPDLVVEGCVGHLVLFRPRKILDPAAFPRFQDEVRTLARLFPGEMQLPEELLKSKVLLLTFPAARLSCCSPVRVSSGRCGCPGQYS